jgi:hypothetical protein
VRQLAGSAKSSAAPLRAEATVTRGDDGTLRLKLVLHAGNLTGERYIDGKSCADLAGATAVALALLLQSKAPLNERDLFARESPGAESSRSEPSSEERPTQDDQTSSPKPASVAHEPPKPEAQPPSKPPPLSSESERSKRPAANVEVRAARRWRMLFQAPTAALGLGPLPRPSFGIGFAGGVSLDHWRLLAAGSAWLRQELTTSDQPGLTANVDRLSAGIWGCRALVLSPLEAAPCFTFAVEHISARGQGEHVAPRTANATWVAAGVGVQAGVRVAPWLGLSAGIKAEIETSRPRISIEGVGNLGQLKPAAVTITVGPEWIL